jgi:hypothetical protein
MEWQSEDRTDLMGEFHNAVVGLVDACKLSPPETVAILRMIAGNTERLFETAVKAPKPKPEQPKETAMLYGEAEEEPDGS